MTADTLSRLVSLSTVALALVFGAAGIAKYLDREGTRDAARGFGVRDRLVGVLAIGLPLVEISIAVLLLPTATRWYAAVAGLGLLLSFCIAIARVMARGEAPDCHCFGQLHSAPVGWRTLARNGVLVGLALVVVMAGRGDPGPSAFGWASRLNAEGWALVGLAIFVLAALTLAGLAVAHVLQAYGRVLVRLENVEQLLREAGFELDEPEDMPELGLPPGTEAPAFLLDSIDGGRVGLAALLEPGRPLLLLFTSPTCGPCSLLMPTVADWQREHGEVLTIALVSAGDIDTIRAEAAEHGLSDVLIDADLAVYRAYEANGTPSAVVVGADGTIGSWLAAGADWIESLVEQTIHVGGDRASGLPIGSELPATTLAGLDGAETQLASVITEPTVLLFWNPGCGYCRSLHSDVRAWEENRPAGSPELLVISAGSAEDVRAEGLASLVLRDPEWSVSSALGADGTPMAVLVDADGRIASSVVGGGPAVLELLGARMAFSAR